MKVYNNNVLCILLATSISSICYRTASAHQQEKDGKNIDENINNDINKNCPDYIYNEKLNVNNAFEFDMDLNVIDRLREDYKKDIYPFLPKMNEAGYSTDDFCLVQPYSPDTDAWGGGEQDDGENTKADMKWYSVNNKDTYDRYLKHVDDLHLTERLEEENIVCSGKAKVYAIFYVVRSLQNKHFWHLDWYNNSKTQTLTFLIPLDHPKFYLAYKDNNNVTQKYNYTLGKAIAFGGGFNHTTDIGNSGYDNQQVFLSVYIGSDDAEIWHYAKKGMVDELEHYINPIKGFTKNEDFPDKHICKPKKGEVRIDNPYENGEEEEEADEETCKYWADNGECHSNPDFMMAECYDQCKQYFENLGVNMCTVWANQGECDANPEYMMSHCYDECQEAEDDYDDDEEDEDDDENTYAEEF